MTTDDTYDQETIDAVLEAHGVGSVDELPEPVRNNLEDGPDARIEDPHGLLRR